MSLTNIDDNVIEIHNLPSNKFRDKFQKSPPELFNTRSSFENFKNQVQDDAYDNDDDDDDNDATNPHETFRAKKVVIEINVSMIFDSNKNKFEIKLLNNDMLDFCASQNNIKNKDLTKSVVTTTHNQHI